jgi:DNA-binding HxlR family transcriptional regulator
VSNISQTAKAPVRGMIYRKTAGRSSCPLVFALGLFGDRWTLLIIRDLLRGKQHFDEFISSSEGIATNILADRLKSLIEQGFVKRGSDKKDKRRFLYELTPRGKSTRQFLRPMIRWARANSGNSRTFSCIPRPRTQRSHIARPQ